MVRQLKEGAVPKKRGRPAASKAHDLNAELDALIAEAAKEAGAASVRDMGRLMRVLMPRVAGRADGKRVKERAEAFLG